MRRPSPTSGYARLVVSLRWLVLLLVGVATWAAVSMLPGLAAAGGGLSGIVTGEEDAVRAQVQAAQRFGLPLLARTAVVQRDPEGLNPYTAARSVLLALEVDKQTLTGGEQPGRDLLAALPLINTPLLVPGAAEQNTAAITYLFADPSLGLGAQARVANDYADRIYGPDNALIGVTGTIPTLVAQGQVIGRWLPLVEAATLAAIALIMGLSFRSVVAPLITLVTAALGYLVAYRVIGTVAQALGVVAPGQLEPILVALMLGITTDYSIFFLSGLQRRLRAGETNPAASVAAVREYLPIVLTAGVIVAAGLGALVVADFALFRAFGPGLAITVLVGLAVSITVVPALMGILGRWAFWPSRFPTAATNDPEDPPPADEQAADEQAADEEAEEEPAAQVPTKRRVPERTWLMRRLGDRRVAAVVVVVVTAVLLVASWPLLGLRSAVAPTEGLPSGNPVREAAAAAGAGFTEGIVAPTEIIVSAPGIAARPAALRTLAAELQRRPGVDIVLGPADQPLPENQEIRLFLGPRGDAARFLVAFDSDALGATAIGHLRALQDAMPQLLAAAGLSGAEATYAGDTALGMSLADDARAALLDVALAVGLVILLLLMLFLRAVVAPLYLLATSVLAVGAALGLTTLLFQGLLGYDGLIFYVPFTAGVLLVSLGSDYNVFSVGYIWEEARRRPLREALAVAVPRSSRAINAAGIALATSFGLVALIPLAAFQELAFAVAVGILIDAFLVRSLLVPALISLVGRASGWPGKRLTEPEETAADPAPSSPPAPSDPAPGHWGSYVGDVRDS